MLTCKGGKSGKLRKMPLDEVEHNGTYGIGPMMGQANVFYRFFPEKLPSAIQRYHNE